MLNSFKTSDAFSICVLIACMTGCAGTGPMKFGVLNSGTQRSPSPAPTGDQTLEVQLALARTLERQGDLDRTEAAYRKILSRHPDQAVALHRLAVIADQRKRYKQSAELFQQALEQQPGSPDLFCDIAYSFYLQRRWTEAEMNFKQAIALDAYHERAHNHLGMLLAQTERSEEALAEFRQAGCSDAESHLNLALALTHCNRLAAARAEFQNARYVSSGEKEVEEKIARVEELLAEADPDNVDFPVIARQSTQRRR